MTKQEGSIQTVKVEVNEKIRRKPEIERMLDVMDLEERLKAERNIELVCPHRSPSGRRDFLRTSCGKAWKQAPPRVEAGLPSAACRVLRPRPAPCRDFLGQYRRSWPFRPLRGRALSGQPRPARVRPWRCRPSWSRFSQRNR